MMRLNDSYSSAPLLLQRQQDLLEGLSMGPDGLVRIPIFAHFVHFHVFSLRSYNVPMASLEALDSGAFLLGFGCDCGATHDRC